MLELWAYCSYSFSFSWLGMEMFGGGVLLVRPIGFSTHELFFDNSFIKQRKIFLVIEYNTNIICCNCKLISYNRVCVVEMLRLYQVLCRGRPVRAFSTRTSNQKFKDLFQLEPNQLPASAKTEPEPATNCWFYRQLVGKTSNISAFFSRNRYQSGKYNGWTGTGTEPNCWYVVGCW